MQTAIFMAKKIAVDAVLGRRLRGGFVLGRASRRWSDHIMQASPRRSRAENETGPRFTRAGRVLT
jgi:hypothetical protein